MKNYELTILFDETLGNDTIEKVNEIIKEHGTIKKIEDGGVKRLAYEIKSREKAHYMYYELEMKDGEPQKLASKLNINYDVLRYLLVRVSK